MREELQKICEEYLKKRDMMAEVFAWYNARLYPVCAGIALEKSELTKEDVVACKKMIEKSTNIFKGCIGSEEEGFTWVNLNMEHQNELAQISKLIDELQEKASSVMLEFEESMRMMNLEFK
jgi:hypothetical protein